MPHGYSRPEGAVPSHHRIYLFIVFEFRSASLNLNPHNSNHVIRPKPKTYQHTCLEPDTSLPSDFPTPTHPKV
jgi:hypothetical protein